MYDSEERRSWLRRFFFDLREVKKLRFVMVSIMSASLTLAYNLQFDLLSLEIASIRSKEDV
jgi:hypothetical protein